MTNKLKKSDKTIVAMKVANKGKGMPAKSGSSPAEQREPRVLTKQNSSKGSTDFTQREEKVSHSLDRVRRIAGKSKDEKLTCLLHHISVEALREAFLKLRKEASPGVDGVTWEDYQEGLQQKLEDLHDRVHKGSYRALPSREVEVSKEDGGKRKLGIASMEDKIVQQAVVTMILYPIYEDGNIFLDFSYGFRPGRAAHQALDAVTVAIERHKVSWVLDCDIRKFFDNVDHEKLIKLIEMRIGDKRVIRLIRKWLKAGVMVGDKKQHKKVGVPQGAVISPVLANIYLHYALDTWFNGWRNRRPRGQMFFVRYADDFVVMAQYKGDALALLELMKSRLAYCSLQIHSEKTRLVEFGRFASENRKKRGEKKPETFNFLGMTHYCTKTRKGRFAVRRKPISKRMTRSLKNVKDTLRKMMHISIKDQGKWLNAVLQGWLNYFAVPGSYRYLRIFRYRMIYLWYKTLKRRSQRSSITWEKMYGIAESHLVKITIRHDWPGKRFDVRMRGRSPVR